MPGVRTNDLQEEIFVGCRMRGNADHGERFLHEIVEDPKCPRIERDALLRDNAMDQVLAGI